MRGAETETCHRTRTRVWPQARRGVEAAAKSLSCKSGRSDAFRSFASLACMRGERMILRIFLQRRAALVVEGVRQRDRRDISRVLVTGHRGIDEQHDGKLLAFA